MATGCAHSAPPSFVHAVEARLATTNTHVVDWWADDLDGDHVPESIAFVCSDDGGFLLVQHGSDMLEAPAEIDGRTRCPAAPATPPAWRVMTSGVIDYHVGHNHGYAGYSLAIRDNRLVLVGQDLQSFSSSDYDLARDGYFRHEDHADYDNLTWSERLQFVYWADRQVPLLGVLHDGDIKTVLRVKPAVQMSGPLVPITDHVRRRSRLIGDSTLAATRGHDATTLHIHADRALVLRDCSSTPCTTTSLAKGDSEIAVAAARDLEVIADKTTIAVHFQPFEGDASYPPPRP
jgi:hypothetical protein